MREKPSLTLSDAQAMLAACRAEAEKNSWPVSVAIVDEGGYLILLERADGAPLPSPEVATLKARSAALFRTSTKALEDVAKDRPGTLAFPERLPVQGGVPILYKGVCVGAIGVSGVKSFEDEQVANAGLAVLG